MSTFNPIHSSLLALAFLSVFLCVYIARPGLKDYLARLLFAYAALLASWALAMLCATSSPCELARSLSCSASLIATFGVPPTAILVAHYLLRQRPSGETAIALTYLPAAIFLAASLTVPSGGYSCELTSYGFIPYARLDALPARLNVAVTALYVPATFVLFSYTWLKPRNLRAKRQSALFLLAAIIGMASTVVMTVLKMPLQYIPSIYSYVFFIYVAMRRYRLALDAPSFAKDRLWDHVRDELVLTDVEGSIVSWNAKAAARFGLSEGEARDVVSLFDDAGVLADYLAKARGGATATLERKFLRVAGKDEDLIAVTARTVRDSYGDGLGFVFSCAGSVPFQAMKATYGVTAKEWEVLGLLATGKEYRDIGELLFVSPFTVKNHVHSAYQKLGVKNRYELLPLLFPQ